jgi:hypothetical protein
MVLGKSFTLTGDVVVKINDELLSLKCQTATGAFSNTKIANKDVIQLSRVELAGGVSVQKAGSQPVSMSASEAQYSVVSSELATLSLNGSVKFMGSQVSGATWSTNSQSGTATLFRKNQKNAISEFSLSGGVILDTNSADGAISKLVGNQATYKFLASDQPARVTIKQVSQITTAGKQKGAVWGADEVSMLLSSAGEVSDLKFSSRTGGSPLKYSDSIDPKVATVVLTAKNGTIEPGKKFDLAGDIHLEDSNQKLKMTAESISGALNTLGQITSATATGGVRISRQTAQTSSNNQMESVVKLSTEKLLLNKADLLSLSLVVPFEFENALHSVSNGAPVVQNWSFSGKKGEIQFSVPPKGSKKSGELKQVTAAGSISLSGTMVDAAGNSKIDCKADELTYQNLKAMLKGSLVFSAKSANQIGGNVTGANVAELTFSENFLIKEVRLMTVPNQRIKTVVTRPKTTKPSTKKGGKL